MKKILLIEDNKLIIKGLKYLLEKEYIFDYAENKETALTKLKNIYDLVILDLTLPDGNGFDIAKTIKDTPIIFLTANDEEENIIKGLSLADEYILKPFRNGELLARISKVLNRSSKEYIYFKNITVDILKQKIFVDNKLIDFTPLEYNIMYTLIINNEKLVTRDKILSIIWDDNGKFVNDNTLSVYIKRIREKLNVPYIKTIKGLGYMLSENEND